MLELYNFAQSTCSLKVRICLAEKGLDWIDRRLVSKDNRHLTPEYLALNPNGVVPTLVHDGTPIIESSVILQYLDDVFPDPALSPADPAGKARMRAWLAFFDHVATPAVRYPSFHFGGLFKKFQSLSREEFDRACATRPLKSEFYRKMGDGFTERDIAKAVDDIRKTVTRMERSLAEEGPWLLGAQYSLADICVAPLIDRMEDLGYAALWEDGLPHVTRWFAGMKARPAYAEAFYDGSRLSQIHADLALGADNPRPVPAPLFEP